MNSLADFIEELRGDPIGFQGVDAFERALHRLDLAGDGNPEAAALFDEVCSLADRPSRPLWARLNDIAVLLTIEANVKAVGGW